MGIERPLLVVGGWIMLYLDPTTSQESVLAAPFFKGKF